jgi:hypothetical protein
MRWLFTTLILLTLACSKKEAPPQAEPAGQAQAEQSEPAAAEITTPEATGEQGAGGTAAASGQTAESPPLPEELQGETPALGAAPEIKIYEAGSDPRQTLRYDVRKGLTQKISADVDATVDAVVAMATVKAPQYTVSYDLSLHVDKVDSDGTAHVAFAVDRASVSGPALTPEADKRLKEALHAVRKVKGSYRMSPRGWVTELEVPVPSGATPTSHEMIDNLRWSIFEWIPIFPDDPVGKGAEWTVHESLEQHGVRINQLRGYKVLRIDGNRVELGMNLRQSAAAQRFKSPGTPQELDLHALEGQATGSFSWKLGELGPTGAKLVAQVVRNVLSVANANQKSVPLSLNNTNSVTIGEAPTVEESEGPGAP